MLSVTFTSEGKKVETELSKEEIDVLLTHKPCIDFDGDGYKIFDFRYDIDTSSFTIWIEKDGE